MGGPGFANSAALRSKVAALSCDAAYKNTKFLVCNKAGESASLYKISCVQFEIWRIGNSETMGKTLRQAGYVIGTVPSGPTGQLALMSVSDLL